MWPFHAWQKAEAVRFNYDEPNYPRTIPPRYWAYDERGWNPDIAERKPLEPAPAKEALKLIFATEGDVEVSKCPMPRHGVVLFDGEVPVASINVCFECGDIKIWPPWNRGEKKYEEMTPDEREAWSKEHSRRSKRQMPRYHATMPKWEKFFRDEVGLTLEPPAYLKPSNP